ncbi:hypothetical protein SCHPADRAFT_253408 [Schizopora paradoxa]|uniref:F-box domain-containing protein n=1 Tax=Schizopora paradoxa TaxID=27342 RepID=A0A0H2S1E2_9AGAM|nr:hypothetical protein SCHPADRAFT_253408 [Schizopora paradoxa]
MRLPPETLDRIFGFIELNSSNAWPKRPGPFVPQWQLYPLLFVCREWFVAAQRLLHSSVSLGSHRRTRYGGGWSLVAGGEDICASFYESIRKNTFLATFARELRLGSYYRSDLCEETLHHSYIISLCKNVEHIEIVGFNDIHRLELKEALLSTNLVELTIFRHGLGGWTSFSYSESSLCTPSEMIAYILRCPWLKKVTIYNTFHRYDDKNVLPSTSAKNLCPDLREINFKEDTIYADHLRLLSEAAPNVEMANITTEGAVAGELRSCLQSWSSTLTHLILRTDNVCRVPSTSVSDTFRGPPSFAVRSIDVPPGMLSKFSRVENVRYSCARIHLDTFAAALQDSSFLPSLRALRFAQDRSLWTTNQTLGGDAGQCLPALRCIRDACKMRGARVEFSLTNFLNRLMNESEAQEMSAD